MLPREAFRTRIDEKVENERQVPNAENESFAYPQAGRERKILPQPVATLGTGVPDLETEGLQRLGPRVVFMMGVTGFLRTTPIKSTSNRET
jgi:hypothetical protein